MTHVFGFFICAVLALSAVVALFRVGINDGDIFGDALVRVRLMQLRWADGAGLYAEVDVDNQNDGPVVVSARARAASPVALFFFAPHNRRTALTRRDRLAPFELLGAVDGRDRLRFLLPVDAAPGTWALRVTAVVDQVAGRTRVITATLLVSRSVDGVPAAGRGVVAGR